MRHLASIAIGLALGATALHALSVPAPRLIGFGCQHMPLGVGLAQHEDDFPGTCDTIRRLPWIERTRTYKLTGIDARGDAYTLDHSMTLSDCRHSERGANWPISICETE